VITLDRYVGVGSFYLAAPNAVRTVARWLQHGPVWLSGRVRGNTRELIDEMADTARTTMARWRLRPVREQRHLGLDRARSSARQWMARVSAPERTRLLRNRAFNALLAEALR
jgi:uncharacterized heparinase superfamily protein